MSELAPIQNTEPGAPAAAPQEIIVPTELVEPPKPTGDSVVDAKAAVDRAMELPPPPPGTPIAEVKPGVSFQDGPVPHETGRPVVTLENGPGVVALPGGVVTSAPTGPVPTPEK